MRAVWTVFGNEIRQYVATPIAVALLAVFWAASGYFFSFNVFFLNAVHMVNSFHNMSILMLLLVPLLTMRIFAEERRSGTLELLLTLPLGEGRIVLGKFLAAEVVLIMMLAGSAMAVVPLAAFGRPDIGPIIGGYIGIFLLGSAFVAIGIFLSSLSQNQVVAAVLTWGILILFWFVDYAANLDFGYSVTRLIRHLSFSIHYRDLIRGVIASDSLVYFASIVIVMLVASAQGLKLRRL